MKKVSMEREDEEVAAPLRGGDREWRPKNTAPTDGGYFIAFDPGVGLLFTMHWDGDGFITANEIWTGKFTHWMPQPEFPK